jgi:hypothetical protein
MIEYQELTEGMEVVVSDGKPEPDEHMSLPWRQWKSHNFIGTVLAVRETEADIDDGNGTTWTISRSIGHTLTPTDPTDDQMNNFFHAQIDTQAEAARQKLSITSPGQLAVYEEMKKEALAWKEGTSPKALPYLQVVAEARKLSVAKVAESVLAKAEEVRQGNLLIESERVKAKLAVAKAKSKDKKELASSVDWAKITGV